MAFINKLVNITRNFSSLQIGNMNAVTSVLRVPSVLGIHTSASNRGLMEFFDDKKNWFEREVKVGRSWRKDELRIKSNSDLHKLWYVLLKEKNMLLTMEDAYKDHWVAMPNPERLDKVEESMENLEAVVRERNKAYWQLEVGETGERPSREEIAFTGLRYRYRLRQHRIPQELNYKHMNFMKMMNSMPDKPYQKEFISLFREKQWAERRRKRTRDFNHVCGLIKRFPNVDREAIKQQYPDVDMKLVMRSARTRGHREVNPA